MKFRFACLVAFGFLLVGCIPPGAVIQGVVDAGTVAWEQRNQQSRQAASALDGLRVGVRSVPDSEAIILSIGGDAFAVGSSALEQSYQAEIRGIAEELNSSAGPVEVTGYTDNVGRDDANQRLSQQRAASVARALVDAGVPRDRISVFGAGSLSPVADNATAAGRALNRRVEVKF